MSGQHNDCQGALAGHKLLVVSDVAVSCQRLLIRLFVQSRSPPAQQHTLT
jgi:hypothetical protein